MPLTLDLQRCRRVDRHVPAVREREMRLDDGVAHDDAGRHLHGPPEHPRMAEPGRERALPRDPGDREEAAAEREETADEHDFDEIPRDEEQRSWGEERKPRWRETKTVEPGPAKSEGWRTKSGSAAVRPHRVVAGGPRVDSKGPILLEGRAVGRLPHDFHVVRPR